MRKLYLVTKTPGTGWVSGKTRAEQHEWLEHAAFMNELAASGFVILGGPVSDTEVVLVIDATDEADIDAMFSDDPWIKSDVLIVKDVREWTILLEHGKEHSN